jgi:Mitochondrial ribosomal protein L51 / S25 / CI-B8 domain
VQLGSKTSGIHELLKYCLPRLKYYNPTVRIHVDNPTKPSAPCLLTLTFEGTDPEALKAIAHKRTKPKEPKINDWKRKNGEPIRPPPRTWPTADEAEVVLKPQPAADPNEPSTAEPPTPIYTRSITLATNGRKSSGAGSIWHWISSRTGGKQVKISPADSELRKAIAEHKEKSEETRQMMKGVQAKIDEEKAALTKAKKAAEEAAAGVV